MSDIQRNNQVDGGEQIESLRRILEAEQGKSFTYEEALEIGQSLIDFFVLLAEDADANAPMTKEAEITEAKPQVSRQPQQMLLI